MIYILFYSVFIFILIFIGIVIFIFFKHTLDDTIGKIGKEPLKTREIEISLPKILSRIKAKKTKKAVHKKPRHELTESTKH
jgi:hypothetical protein